MAEFVAVGRADGLSDGDMRAFDVQDTTIAVANVGGTFYAFGDTCTHMKCSLAEGDLEETTVTCLCHGSEFDVTSGEVLTPPAREPVASYETRVGGENLEIKVQ
jgi:3-phenylpropionate/trans-cinnamate dioxygenase ferredoxin component